jgi:twitching motility protein PilT
VREAARDIDRLIDAMRKHQATELLIEEGKRPNMLVGGSRVAVSYPELDRPGILRLLAALLGDAGAERLRSERAADFAYTTSSGVPVVGAASAQGDALRVSFRPGDGAGAALDAPAAAAAEIAAHAAASGGAHAAPRLVALLSQLVARRGSDLHVSSANRPVLRIDGEMVAIAEHPPLSGGEVERMLFEMTPAKNRDEFRERDDTDFALHVDGLGRFRANLFRDRKGIGGVFRVIPSNPMGADEIGLPPGLVDRITRLNKGLVLVTGPTGSGKSTTLTALIDRINAVRPAHIITIEDPIEFLHENRQCLINQREVGEHTRSFKNALRAALREDPDIILVGEMRDLETTAIAIETAETGHLVFGTLHTTTAVSTVSRVVDQFPADRQGQIRLMLADSLKIVLCQTLLRREGGGRIAAMEILVGTGAVANLIREGKSFQIPSIIQSSRAEGMLLLSDALMDLVKRKLVSPAEAYAKAIDKGALRSLFEKNGVALPK